MLDRLHLLLSGCCCSAAWFINKRFSTTLISSCTLLNGLLLLCNLSFLFIFNLSCLLVSYVLFIAFYFRQVKRRHKTSRATVLLRGRSLRSIRLLRTNTSLTIINFILSFDLAQFAFKFPDLPVLVLH